MTLQLSVSQQEVVGRAGHVAREHLAPRAERYDAEGVHPRESWHDLWQHGLLAMAVPEEYGGLGLDMPTYCMVVEKLAAGCTNTAMTVHMHSTVMRFIAALASPKQKAAFYPEVVEEGRLYGSWGSEPERRGGAGQVQTTIVPWDGGYRINGQKHFCTMAGAAHRYMVHCSLQGADPQESLLAALVPHDAPGLKVLGEWNTLGMRATVSPSVALENCQVPADAVLGKPGQAARSGVGQGFGLGYAAVYLGAAQEALDFTIDYCKTHRFEPDPTPLAQSLVIQRHVAEMTLALEGARLMLYQSANRWAEADNPGRAILASRAKYLATEAALMVTSRAIQCVGGRSAHKRYPLERLFRDVRTATLMPPNLDRCLEVVGKAELGQELPSMGV